MITTTPGAHTPCFGLHFLLSLGLVTMGPGEVFGVYLAFRPLLCVTIVPSIIYAWRSGVRSKAHILYPPRRTRQACHWGHCLVRALAACCLAWHGLDVACFDMLHIVFVGGYPLTHTYGRCMTHRSFHSSISCSHCLGIQMERAARDALWRRLNTPCSLFSRCFVTFQ